MVKGLIDFNDYMTNAFPNRSEQKGAIGRQLIIDELLKEYIKITQDDDCVWDEVYQEWEEIDVEGVFLPKFKKHGFIFADDYEIHRIHKYDMNLDPDLIDHLEKNYVYMLFNILPLFQLQCSSEYLIDIIAYKKYLAECSRVFELNKRKIERLKKSNDDLKGLIFLIIFIAGGFISAL